MKHSDEHHAERETFPKSTQMQQTLHTAHEINPHFMFIHVYWPATLLVKFCAREHDVGKVQTNSWAVVRTQLDHRAVPRQMTN